MITTIIDCCERKIPGISIIADGGVKNYGDVAKAIICGADAVMVGSMLSGTKECPSKAKNEDGEYVYRGMASTASQSEWRGYVGNGLEEGVSMVVKSKGPAKNVIEKMAAGLRSAMAYTGAYTIRNFHEMGEIMEITQSGFIEGLPHGLLNK
jgi:IMP dehydrogenase/GMP reductase